MNQYWHYCIYFILYLNFLIFNKIIYELDYLYWNDVMVFLFVLIGITMLINGGFSSTTLISLICILMKLYHKITNVLFCPFFVLIPKNSFKLHFQHQLMFFFLLNMYIQCMQFKTIFWY